NGSSGRIDYLHSGRVLRDITGVVTAIVPGCGALVFRIVRTRLEFRSHERENRATVNKWRLAATNAASNNDVLALLCRRLDLFNRLRTVRRLREKDACRQCRR